MNDWRHLRRSLADRRSRSSVECRCRRRRSCSYRSRRLMRIGERQSRRRSDHVIDEVDAEALAPSCLRRRCARCRSRRARSARWSPLRVARHRLNGISTYCDSIRRASEVSTEFLLFTCLRRSDPRSTTDRRMRQRTAVVTLHVTNLLKLRDSPAAAGGAAADCGGAGPGGGVAGQAPRRPRPTRLPHPIPLPRPLRRPGDESERMADEQSSAILHQVA